MQKVMRVTNAFMSLPGKCWQKKSKQPSQIVLLVNIVILTDNLYQSAHCTRPAHHIDIAAKLYRYTIVLNMFLIYILPMR